MKVLLVDNRNLFLEGLQNLLSSYGIEVTEIALNGAEILKKMGSFEPDVIIMNLTGDEREELEVIRYLKNAIPEAHIIVFTDDEENSRKAAQNGAYTYRLTEIHVEELVQKLHEVEQGKTF